MLTGSQKIAKDLKQILLLRAVITDVLGGCFLRVVFSKVEKPTLQRKNKDPQKTEGSLFSGLFFPDNGMLGVGRVARQGHLSDDPPWGLPLR